MSVVLNQCKTGSPVYGGITDMQTLKENLLENSIPDGFEHMGIGDYPSFLEQRRKLMAMKIRKYYESLK